MQKIGFTLKWLIIISVLINFKIKGDIYFGIVYKWKLLTII